VLADDSGLFTVCNLVSGARMLTCSCRPAARLAHVSRAMTAAHGSVRLIMLRATRPCDRFKRGWHAVVDRSGVARESVRATTGRLSAETAPVLRVHAAALRCSLARPDPPCAWPPWSASPRAASTLAVMDRVLAQSVLRHRRRQRGEGMRVGACLGWVLMVV